MDSLNPSMAIAPRPPMVIGMEFRALLEAVSAIWRASNRSSAKPPMGCERWVKKLSKAGVQRRRATWTIGEPPAKAPMSRQVPVGLRLSRDTNEPDSSWVLTARFCQPYQLSVYSV